MSMRYIFCTVDIVRTSKPYATKLGMMVYHHAPGCHAKGYLAVFKVKVTVQGQIFYKLTVSCHEFWNLLQPNLVYIYKDKVSKIIRSSALPMITG